MHVEVHVSSHLTPEEWDAIDLFKRRVEQLSNTKLGSSSEHSHIQAQIKWEKGKELQFTATLPPEEVITEHLLAFRHFCLEKEPCFLPRILNLLAKHATDPQAHFAFKSIRKKWKNALFADALRLQLNGETLTAARLIDLWFNGEYFHSDRHKSDQLRYLVSAFPNDFAKYMLVDAVIESTKVILMIGDGLKSLSRENHT